jgi:alkylmercury lyase
MVHKGSKLYHPERHKAEEALVKKNDKIEELAALLFSNFTETFDPQSRILFGELIPMLAQGRPLSVERIAGAAGRSRDAVVATLRALPSVEWDDDGNVVGAGLTLRPTRHRFNVHGRALYTWCALDALMFPALLGETVEVESPCISTGKPVRVRVTPGDVVHVEPPGAVVSLVAPEATADIRRAFCDYVNFFSSEEAAAAWLASHPGATTLPVKEAYRLGDRLAQFLTV